MTEVITLKYIFKIYLFSILFSTFLNILSIFKPLVSLKIFYFLDRDCLDGSDEDEEYHNCQNRQCKSDEFRCESGVRNRPHTKCIKIGQTCDK